VTARQTGENHLHRARSRTSLKKVRELVAAGKLPEAVAEVSIAQSYLDKAAKRGSFHANTSARYKSRLVSALKAAGNKDAVPARKKTKPAQTKAKSAKPKATASSKAKAAPKKAAPKKTS
jgi:small subunit ribosomal protein S20